MAMTKSEAPDSADKDPTSPDLVDCTLLSKSPMKKAATPDSGLSELKRQKMDEPEGKKTALKPNGFFHRTRCYMGDVFVPPAVKKGHHVCEFRGCCMPDCTKTCYFCDGQHWLRHCAAVVDVTERKMIMRSKGLCTSCGLSLERWHSSGEILCTRGKCDFCPSHHLSSLCPSYRHYLMLHNLAKKEKLPLTNDILKIQTERSAIYAKQWSKERRL